MKFLKYRLMNETTGDEGGGFNTASGGMSAESAYEASSNSPINDETDAFQRYGLDPKKYGLDSDSKDEAIDEESQGSDETQEAGQETDEKSYLEWVNSLGAIHNENPVKVESAEEVKNALQMYKDYTQKTQSLSEERKAWDSERSIAEEELNKAIQEFNTNQESFSKQIQELQQWTFTLNQLREDAPDVFEEVQRAFSGVSKQFSNPILDQQLKAINSRLAEAEKALTSREDQLILDKFESEKTQMSAVEQSMKELGVTVDWDKAKAKWASSGMPLDEVVGAMYFKQMAQAKASKEKVEATKAKVNTRPTGGAGGSRNGQKAKVIDPKLKGLEYAKALWDKHSA